MGQFFEYVKMALDNIRANKGRSFLTMLGIIIGITSVVTIVSIGNGLKSDVMNEMDQQTSYSTIITNTEATTNTTPITPEDLDALRSSLGDMIETIQISTTFGGCRVSTGKGNFEPYLTMTVPDAERGQYASKVVAGSFFTQNDVDNANLVCVIPELTALYFFGNTDVIGMTFDLEMNSVIKTVTIIGLTETNEDYMNMEKQYIAMGFDPSVEITMPYTTAALFGDEISGFSNVTLSSSPGTDTNDMTVAAVNLLNSRHSSEGEDMFMHQKPIDFAAMYGPMLDGVTAFVALVAGISLLVGGIGVMNIMLVSVTERTREIGIRKSLGAKTGSIITQFLCESAIISGMGGMIGIIFGGIITAIISALKIGGITAHLSVPAVLIATTFSCAVGIVFGIYPARKAAQLSPIEALRRM